MTAIATARDLAIAGRLAPTSVEIGTSQLIGLVGPNGSGKTSLLHALAGIPPSRGSVTINGCDPHRLPPEIRQSLVSYLPASRDIAWPITGRDFIRLALPQSLDWAEVVRRFELDDLLDRRMDRLSTGERARVMIARALATDAALLLLDEPIANLDPYWQRKLLDELRRRSASAGKSAILAIHDLTTALAWSDRLWLMEDGNLVADAEPRSMRESGALARVFRIDPQWTAVRPVDRQSSP